MMVEHLVECPDCGEEHVDGVVKIELCASHASVLRSLLIQAGCGEDLDLTPNQKMERMLANDPDPKTEIETSLSVGVMGIFGGQPFGQHHGCPVCVLEGTLSRAVDEVVSKRRKKN